MLTSAEMEMPDITLRNTAYTLSVGEGMPIEITARELKVFLAEEKVLIEECTFRSDDENGEPFITGHAGYGRILPPGNVSSRAVHIWSSSGTDFRSRLMS